MSLHCNDPEAFVGSMRAPRWRWVALTCWLLSSCATHYVTRGADLYADGNYVGAAEVFEHTESRLVSASAEERARYGLYRGATFLNLGETTAARHWLGYAMATSKTHPEVFTQDERVMLERALLNLEYADAKAASAAATASADSNAALR